MNSSKPEKIQPELKKLVLWKLDTELPPNFKLSIGNKGTFTKEELKKNIEEESEIGRLYVKMELSFMKDLISGKVTETLAK